MCGIWGFFPNNGKFDLTDMGLLDQIMTITALRGKDSTGVAVISELGMKPRTIKMVGGPDYLLNSDAWGKVAEFALKKGTAMFGHGRYGTKGAAVAKNAHPHTVDHITLVHNGTIQWGLDEVMKELNTDNDSYALTHQIAKFGLVDALDSVVGAYALIVHDAKQGKVFFVRNDERPLHMIEYMQSVILMSEGEALKFLVERGNTYYKPEIKFFSKHVIYEIDLTTGKLTHDDSLVEKKAKKYTSPALPPPMAGQKSWQPSGGGHKTTSITCSYSEGRKLMLIDCEKMPKGSDFRLTFMDEDNAEVASYTRFDQKDRLGEDAIAYAINVTRVNSTGKKFLHTTYKDLKWPNEAPKKETGEVTGQSVTFRNQISVSKSEAKRILSQHDCSLCQGVVREAEIPATILMSNNQLLCPDCCAQGKHHPFGFGQ